MRSSLAASVLLLGFLWACPKTALAGTVCGTVTDGLTAGPVVGAGIFVYHPGGAWAGHAAVTDVVGAFCITDLPAGTYDLQVRVDNYLEKVISGIVVEGEVSGVVVELAARLRLAPPNPNPARDRVQLSFELTAPSPVDLQIFDVTGRLVQGWRSEDLGAGAHSTVWTFRDRDGHLVRPGIYFVRMSAAGSHITRRIVFIGQ